MSNEFTDDAQFRAIISRDMVGDITATALEDINKERCAIVASMRRYLEYLNTLMPHDAEWSRARGYLLYLVKQLQSLNTAESAHIQEFFKSSNEAAMDCVNYLIR